MTIKARLHLLSTVSALALAGNAFAADMPVKAPPPAVVVAPSWSGFYLGGHGGVGWLRHEQNITSPNVTFLSCTTFSRNSTCAIRDTGAVFGAQAGYNLQVQQWVFGVESDVSWTSLSKTGAFFPLPNPTVVYSVHDRIDWLASVRGRLGWAANDWLFYATGGVAFTNFTAGHFREGAGGIIMDRVDKAKVGWVAGGGIEKMFNRNWSARAEFLHYGFGRASHTISPFNNTYTTSFRNDISVVRLGINYRP